MKLVKKILGLLTPAERRRAYLLLLMILFMALLDVIGVASIMPFMAVLSNPVVIETNKYLSAAYAWFGFRSKDDFLFLLGLFVFVMLLVSIGFKGLTNWALLRFTHMRSYTLGRRLISAYLHQRYEWYLNRNSAGLSKAVLAEVNLVVNGSLIPTLQLIAHGSVVVAILALLIAVNPEIAIVTGLVFGTLYGGIYFVLRKKLGEWGRRRNSADTLRFQTLNEVFGGIKDVKLAGLERVFLSKYDVPARMFARAQSTAAIASQLPKYVLEIFAFGSVLAVCLYLMKTTSGVGDALPILALYALAGYKLMPALQHTYAQLALLRFSEKALDDLHADLTCTEAVAMHHVAAEPMPLRQSIVLDGVSYTYPESSKRIVKDLDIVIPALSTVGFVGSTGSGKTTTIDILLGLLRPQAGRLLVDGVPVTNDNLRAWQGGIGYVPQHIYLTDDTVAANIAFGVDPSRIDHERVIRSARAANIHEHVIHELAQGYQTRIGERGIRLSGGQRQRIGIARALYRQPQLLILDEATSALDNVTEQAVMEEIYALGHELTIVLIAHRLSTVRNCDRIFVMRGGRCVGQGTYEQLLEENTVFQAMARATEQLQEAQE